MISQVLGTYRKSQSSKYMQIFFSLSCHELGGCQVDGGFRPRSSVIALAKLAMLSTARQLHHQESSCSRSRYFFLSFFFPHPAETARLNWGRWAVGGNCTDRFFSGLFLISAPIARECLDESGVAFCAEFFFGTFNLVSGIFLYSVSRQMRRSFGPSLFSSCCSFQWESRILVGDPRWSVTARHRLWLISLTFRLSAASLLCEEYFFPIFIRPQERAKEEMEKRERRSWLAVSFLCS